MTCPREKTVLITGGAGFIGSHLSRALINNGWSVAIVDNLSAGFRENVPQAARLYVCDIRDLTKLKHVFALERPELVVHLAAQTDVRHSIIHPNEDFSINVAGTRNVITQSRTYGAKKFIFASTAEIYGEPAELPITERTPLKPQCPYAENKLKAEESLKQSGLDFVIFRFANFYGPGQNGLAAVGIIAILFERALRNLPVIKMGDWTQTRDFIYIDDGMAALLKAVELDTSQWPAHLRVLNLGTKTETSIEDLVLRVEKLTHRQITIGQQAEDPGHIQRNAVAYEQAEKLLGWRPITSLSDGLKTTLQARVAKLATITPTH